MVTDNSRYSGWLQATSPSRKRLGLDLDPKPEAAIHRRNSCSCPRSQQTHIADEESELADVVFARCTPRAACTVLRSAHVPHAAFPAHFTSEDPALASGFCILLDTSANGLHILDYACPSLPICFRRCTVAICMCSEATAARANQRVHGELLNLTSNAITSSTYNEGNRTLLPIPTCDATPPTASAAPGASCCLALTPPLHLVLQRSGQHLRPRVPRFLPPCCS